MRRVTSPRPKKKKVPRRARMEKGSEEAKEWSKMMLEKKRQKKMEREKLSSPSKKNRGHSKKLKMIPFANNTVNEKTLSKIKTPTKKSRKPKK